MGVGRLVAEQRNAVQRFWGRSARVFLPVVHVCDESQALRNVGVACAAGADGVFLINHAVNYQRLLQVARRVSAAHADLFVGVNCLDLRPQDVFGRLPEGVRGVWSDNAGYLSGAPETPAAVDAARRESRWDGVYFGGVAFKYQELRGSPEAAAQAAIASVDVLTTSGPATGQPPALEKIQRMRVAIGAHPLAVASGITPENVAPFLPLVDCFLVATGISRGFDELDADLTRELAHRIHAAAPSEPS